MDLHIKELVLEIYSDNPSLEINMHSIYDKTRRALGRASTDVETIVYWLEDSGFCGKNRSKPKKIVRNEPCPCDSGLKYKKCCGRKGQAKKS
ncbi:MAG: SEC-C metal-binding domain-containing protein [archaeon]|nr:SEC-C metal-binding domain-containing protein [archaeon]